MERSMVSHLLAESINRWQVSTAITILKHYNRHTYYKSLFQLTLRIVPWRTASSIDYPGSRSYHRPITSTCIRSTGCPCTTLDGRTATGSCRLQWTAHDWSLWCGGCWCAQAFRWQILTAATNMSNSNYITAEYTKQQYSHVTRIWGKSSHGYTAI